MNRNGPIIIIEDDLDDQQLLIEAFKNLNYINALHFFSDGQKAFDFLNAPTSIRLSFYLTSICPGLTDLH